MTIPSNLIQKGKFSIVGLLVFLALTILAYVVAKWVYGKFTETTLVSYDSQGNILGTGVLKTSYKKPSKPVKQPAKINEANLKQEQ